MMRSAVFASLASVCLACAASAQEAPGDPFRAYDAGNYDAAAREAQAALLQDADNSVWWALLAEARAKLVQHGEAAEAFARAADLESDPAKRSYLRRAQAMQLVYSGGYSEAREIVRAAMAETTLATRSSLDWAMVAIAARDDRSAQEILANEALYPDFTRQSALDAGYSAKRLGMDARAVRFFETGLALDAQEEKPLAPAPREAIRRENRELTRDWSVLSQASYSTAGQPAGPANTPLADDRALQVGAEISRRIGGWRDGRPLSLFARAFHSEFLSEDAAAGSATQGWLGVRYKPLSRVNLNLEASRLIGIDDDALDDWSLRAAISGGRGLEPEIGRTSWPYAHYYGDLSYLTDAGVTFGLAEGRAGYSFLLDQGATVLTPYAVARAGLDTGRLEEEAIGAGAGISLRHWFDETERAAYRGFIDFDVQARERIAGDRRASGVLVTVTMGR